MVYKLEVAYVVVMFPCYSETFVLREIIELRRRGVDVSIVSLRPFSEKIMDADARPLLPRTLYSPYLLSLRLLRSNLGFLLRHPREYAGILLLLLSRLASRPKELAKSLALFPKSVHFARILMERGVRHIHAHFANYPATSAYIMSRLTGIPFTVTAHAHDIFQSQALLQVKAARAKRVFTISEYNRSFISNRCPGVPAEKIEVMHCGLDLSRMPRAERSAVEKGMILSVGRMMAIKGFDTLVRAAAVMKGRGLRPRCVIVGDGPERSSIEALVSGLGVGDVVELAGERTPQEVLSMMERCEVFVLASRPAGAKNGVMDGIPVSLMEAMALGVPVVSCAVSGIPELVEDGRTGLLVSPGDYEALAGAIERLMRDAELRKRLTVSARRKVEREFNIARSINRLLDVIKQGEGRG